MTAGDRSRWEARYGQMPDGASEPPSAVLARHAPRTANGRALDVACGSGRNALYLARRGWRVDAIDVAHAGLMRLRAAAVREGLRVHPVQADLERFALPHAHYDLVVNVRYLQRSLLAPIAAAIVPGGLLVFETFLRAQAGLGHPRNPAFLLEPGELRASFADFEVLESWEGLCGAEGHQAHLARLVARRPRD